MHNLASMDPALYDEAEHRARLLRQMRAAETIVYAAAFAPAFASSEPTLVAATSTGALHVFALRPMLQPQYWERVTQQQCVLQNEVAFASCLCNAALTRFECM